MFTREHTKVAKGIAVVLLLYFHLFISADRMNNSSFSIINLVVANAQDKITLFCKICVCIFVFFTGYGMFFSLKKYDNISDSYKTVFYRAISFMFNYIVIYFLFVPIGIFLGYYNVDLWQFIWGIFGLDIQQYNAAWWYINQYIIILIVLPIIVYCFTKAKLIKKICYISILFFCYVLLRVLIKYVGTNSIIDNYFWYIENYAIWLSVFSGMLFAKYDVLVKICKCINKFNHTKICYCVVSIVTIILAFILRNSLVADAGDMRFDFFVVPLFIFSATYIIYNSKLKNMFILIGNHSTNIFLSHEFICYTYFQDVVFAPYYSEFIIVWLVVLSLGASYLINLIYVPLNNFIFGKEHKLNYNGYFSFSNKKR